MGTQVAPYRFPANQSLFRVLHKENLDSAFSRQDLLREMCVRYKINLARRPRTPTRQYPFRGMRGHVGRSAEI